MKNKKTAHKSVAGIEANIRQQLNQVNSALRAFSIKLTGNEPDANDLFQSTVLRIMSNMDKYTPGTNFKAWVITIMRNIFINNYRRKARRRTIIDHTPNNYYLNSGAVAIKNNAESTMAYKELLRMVNALPENFKRPFWMAYKGYRYDEIAEEMNAPLGTIKSRIFFARRKLQDMYNNTMLENIS